jgi:hypothetical protein
MMRLNLPQRIYKKRRVGRVVQALCRGLLSAERRTEHDEQPKQSTEKSGER